jgi:hypothetical protein
MNKETAQTVHVKERKEGLRRTIIRRYIRTPFSFYKKWFSEKPNPQFCVCEKQLFNATVLGCRK